MQKLLVISILFSLTLAAVARESNAEYFVKTPQGVRAQSLGNAVTAISDDPLCVYWNPAGIALSREMDLSSCHSQKMGNAYTNDYLVYLYPFQKHGTLGLSYFNQTVDDITVLGTNPNLAGTVKDDQHDFVLSYGYTANDHFCVGTNFKYLAQKNTVTARGLECDTGLLYKGNRYIDFGLTIADWWPTSFTWTTGKEEYIPTTVRSGFLYHSPQEKFRAELDGEFTADRDSVARFGGEYKMNNFLALRGGYELGYGEGGNVSLGFGLTHENWKFDYTWTDSDLGSSNLFGATVAFDHPRRKKHAERSEQLIGSELNEIKKEMRDETIEQKPEASKTTMDEVIARYNHSNYVYKDAENAKAGTSEAAAVSESDLTAPGKEHFDLGNVYLLRKMYTKSIEEYLKTIETDPNFAKVHFNLAAIYQKIEMDEKSIYEYRYALKLEPDNLNALLALGNLYYNKGQSDKSVIYYNKVIILAPQSLQADVARKRLGNL
ncbi:MAG: PorV/PorQ family protein [Candidatus Wallbacteria bacterium]|nr:PorV/PorQ family protein [Candidatus Wallbacteria bacterium]